MREDVLDTHPWSRIDDVHGVRVRICFQNTFQKLFIFLTTGTEARQRLRASSDGRLEVDQSIDLHQLTNVWLVLTPLGWR